MSQPDLSVILASQGPAPCEAALTALHQGCEGTATELIVVSAAGNPLPGSVGEWYSDVRFECRPAGTPTPVLWGAGLQVARGAVVAFTTDQVRVAAGWAASLLQCINSGAVGAGGPIGLGTETDRATAAACFIRFSAFAPEAWTAASPTRDIPGDNAAYRREAIMSHPDLLRDGFWEVEFHRRFERDGLTLRMVPEAVATLVGPVPIGAMLRQRFRHGREFGRSRVRRHGESPVKLLLASPLVPMVLLVRTARRIWRIPRYHGRLLAALPWLGVLAIAWAWGEAAGAVGSRGPGHQ